MVAKSKFILTEDLVKVEKDQSNSQEIIDNKKKKIGETERISLNINSKLKISLHMFCVNKRKNMTSIIELAIEEYLNNYK